VEKLSSPSVLDYLHQSGKMVFESYRAKVMLVERATPQKSVAKTP
jgi:hypothetical protein